jgi:hypothetical protein
MKKKQYKKYIKLYLNRIAFDHLQYKLQTSPPEFKYDIDVFYSIIHDLSNIEYYKDYEDKGGYIHLYSITLKEKYGSNYNLYIQYLASRSIIYVSEYYIVGDKSFYYKLLVNDMIIGLLNRYYYNDSTLCFHFNDIISDVTLNSKEFGEIQKEVKKLGFVCVKILTTNPVGKKIIKEYALKSDIVKHSDLLKNMFNHYKSTVKINVDAAVRHTKNSYEGALFEASDEKGRETAINKYNHRIRSILAIEDIKSYRFVKFSRGKNNKRLNTHLTNMAKDLRQFLIGYENMSYLDLSNSQPVLFNVLLNEYINTNDESLKKEIAHYKELTIRGEWYEFLMKEFKTDRDNAKIIWMEIAYSKNNSHKGHKKIFNKKFPLLNEIIEDAKKDYHGDFAIKLQRIESEIFIDEICKELVEAGIMPYTLHDGVLVPKDKEMETYDIMIKVLTKHLGKAPVISINGEKRYPK